MSNREIIFKANYWSYKEESDDIQIHIAGLTEKEESVHCIVKGFKPFVYLELPKRIAWNELKCQSVIKYFSNTMGATAGPKPFARDSFQQKMLLQQKKVVLVLKLEFNTHKASLSFANICKGGAKRKSLIIPGIGKINNGEFKVHEQNIDPIIKFTAIKNIKLSSFLKVTEYILPGEQNLSADERKFSSADIDFYASWKDVEPHIPKTFTIIKPKYMCFDIECNSHNQNSKLPDPSIPENFIIQIASVVGRVGDHSTKMKNILYSLFEPKPIKDTIVVTFESEEKLLLAWAQLINEENPDIFITYNGMKFDWNYILARADALGIINAFSQITRIIGEKAEIKKMLWASSAYGEQIFNYPDTTGRTNVDVMLEVERNYRLPKYTLDTVSEFFLGEHKDDVSARQIFMIVTLCEQISPLLSEYEDTSIIPKKLRIRLKTLVQKLLPRRKCSGIVTKVRNRLLSAVTKFDFIDAVRDAITAVGQYCKKDTVLTVRVFEKLNLDTTMEQMSNCMNVPKSYLHTRGQQIKVLAQVYRETVGRGIIIPYASKDNDIVRFEGAVVIEANPGDYQNVLCFDFESLYPSMMITYNICYTTYIDPKDTSVPDEECNIIQISSHKGCQHDIKKRKVKEKDILCRELTHRFRKVKILPDGTKLHEGLMAKLERNLLSERKLVKKTLAKIKAKYDMATGAAKEKDIAEYKKRGYEIIEKGSLSENEVAILKITAVVEDAIQMSLKVSANSAYGGLGAQRGFLPLVEGAESVTAMGRDLITKAIKYITEKYKTGKYRSKLVYGDSVTFDTPILCKYKDDMFYTTISELGDNREYFREWQSYIGAKDIAIARDTQCVQVWSDEGFTPIKTVIRHRTNKNIYRVSCEAGSVDVTEDHSLLLDDNRTISPKNLDVGNKIKISELPPSLDLAYNCAKSVKHRRNVPRHPIWDNDSSIKLEKAKEYYIQNYDLGGTYNITEKSNIVNSILPLGSTEDYVYDIETENHHFAAGVGQIVVHNTDSGMLTFPELTTQESFEMGDKVSKEASHYLKCYVLKIDENFMIANPEESNKEYRIDKYPRDKMSKLSDVNKVKIHTYDACPINLQFENLYKRYFLLSKKRYIAYPVTRDGVISKATIKGVVSTRRDNSTYLKDTYKSAYECVLQDKTEKDCISVIDDSVQQLFTRQIKPAKFIIYTGIKNIMNYAKKKEFEVNGKKQIVFIGSDDKQIDNVSGPLDPRLIYPNLPQVLLTLKMMRRGDDVPPNTRLEYLYIENPAAVHQGEKAEDYTYYRENRLQENLKPDLLHYIEKQLLKPITELLTVKWPHEMLLYEKPDLSVKRITSSTFNELQTCIIDKIKSYTKKIERTTSDRYKVGWSTICKVCKKKETEEDARSGILMSNCRCPKHRHFGNIYSKDKDIPAVRVYTYKNIAAKVEYVLESVKRKKDSLLLPLSERALYIQDIDEKMYSEDIRLCRLWKSRSIIDRLYKQHGIKKRPFKRPKQAGDNLRIGTNVILVEDIKDKGNKILGKKGEEFLVKLVESTPVEGYVRRKKYTYSLEKHITSQLDSQSLENEQQVKVNSVNISEPIQLIQLDKVERTSFTTYRYKDGTIMKDILLARGSYKKVVDHLSEKFARIRLGLEEPDDADEARIYTINDAEEMEDTEY